MERISVLTYPLRQRGQDLGVCIHVHHTGYPLHACQRDAQGQPLGL